MFKIYRYIETPCPRPIGLVANLSIEDIREWRSTDQELTIEDARYQFKRGCADGDLAHVKGIESQYEDCFDVYAIRVACEEGRLGVIEYLHDHYRDRVDITMDHNAALNKACTRGHADIVQYLLDKWGTEIEAVIRTDTSFLENSTYFKRPCVLLLLDTYPNLFDAQSKVFEHYNLFYWACKNGWTDVIGLMLDGFRLALIKLPIWHDNNCFMMICEKGWSDILKRLLTEITDTAIRKNLVESALRRCFIYSHYDLCVMLVDRFPSDISGWLAMRMCYDCCDYGKSTKPEQDHAFTNLVLDRFGHTFTPKSWYFLFKTMCTTGCANLSQRFATDLSSKVENAAYDQVIQEVVYYKIGDNYELKHDLDIEPTVAFIKTFVSNISTPVLKLVFEAACYTAAESCPFSDPIFSKRSIQGALTILAALLDCASDRVDLKLITIEHIIPCLENCSLNEIQTVLRFCDDNTGLRSINDIIRSRWSDWDIAKALIEHYRDVINAPILLQLTVSDVRSSLPNYQGWGRAIDTQENLIIKAKYVLDYFFTDINTNLITDLFSLPAKILYQLLSVGDVKILVDDHKGEEGFDRIAKMLDPSHPNTAFALADYGIRGIKAHGF